jgi:23S rRNA U2552 (ribose-2'-O)-methylase RlmE/FtsJ
LKGNISILAANFRAVYTHKKLCIKFDKIWVDYVMGDFFTKLSGRREISEIFAVLETAPAYYNARFVVVNTAVEGLAPFVLWGRK